MNGIKYYYINLDKRTDRRKHIEEQFGKFQITNYERVSAVHDSFGPIGCVKSHILALQYFIVSKEASCIVLEDDFEFTISKNQYTNLFMLLDNSNIEWNIVMLSGNILKHEKYNDFLNVCVEGQTTSGYLINKKFVSKLLSNYQECLGLLSNFKTRNQNLHTIDQYWKKLQGLENKWFVFNPKCGKQTKSFSDIENRVVSYHC